MSNRTAIYLRVSTADQKPDLQFDGLHAYATRAGLEIVQEFLDVAVSGRKQGRPQLDALMQAARDYAFDCVLVWKFDRFARSTKHLLTALEEFDHLGIRFVSIQDQIDTTSPMGKSMFTLISATPSGAHRSLGVDKRKSLEGDTPWPRSTYPNHAPAPCRCCWRPCHRVGGRSRRSRVVHA